MIRLNRVADDWTFDTANVGVAQVEGSLNITAGDVTLISLNERDTHTGSDGERRAEADHVVEAIRDGVKNVRESKSPATLARGAIYSLLATVFLILLMKLFSHAFRYAHRLVAAGKGRFIPTLRIQKFELVNTERIAAALGLLITATRVMLTLLIFYVYIPTVLSFFPWTANLAPKLYGYVVHPLATIYRVVIEYVPNLFFIIAIAFVTRYLLKTVRYVFSEVGTGNLEFNGFYKEWADPTYKLVRVIIIAFSFVMAFPFLPGSSSPAFQGVSVFLGILLSLGSTSAVSNIVAGVVITYMRPFKEGDRVKIADTTRDVIEKNLLVTRVRTIKNVDITIPNASVLGTHIINYSSDANHGGLILNTTITIGYDVPWRQIHELMIGAALRCTDIDKSKKPFVLQTALNDFNVSYELNAYTNQANRMAAVYSELHQNIQDSFNEAGVEIMSPGYLSVRDGSEVTIPKSYRESPTPS